MKREWTILQDDREKKPLLFPEHLVCLDTAYPAAHQRSCTVRLVVRKARLSFGDYLLEEAPSATVIERKSSLSEVAVNCLHEGRRANFVTELLALKAHCSDPIVLFEGDPSSPSLFGPASPDLALDALVCILREYGVAHSFIPGGTIPQRQAAAKYAARLLIRGITHVPSPGLRTAGLQRQLSA